MRGLVLGLAYEISGSLWAAALLNCWSASYGMFFPVGSFLFALAPMAVFIILAVGLSKFRLFRKQHSYREIENGV